jgi:3-oxoadipate enol-lactonase / 4-carboxymuconolactone decarboxylase
VLGRDIAAAVPGAEYVELDAAHLSNIEQAGAFNAALMRFLTDDAVTEDTRRAIGDTMRRSVLGDAHVDRSAASRTAFNGEFLDYITRTAWGETWTRPGLPRHTRSLLTIAMMVALNRPEELRLHLNAARNNGVTRDDINEVLLQTAIYCGVPAANSAYHLAATVFAEQDRGSPG